MEERQAMTLPSWLRNLFRIKYSGWCGKCLYGCVMAATEKEKK